MTLFGWLAALSLVAPPQAAADEELARLEALFEPPGLDLQITGGFTSESGLVVSLLVGEDRKDFNPRLVAQRARVAELRRLLLEAPESAHLHIELGRLLSILRGAEETSVLVADAASAQRIARLGEEWRRHVLEAERLLRPALERGGSEEDALAYADCLAQLGRHLEAREVLERLVLEDSWRAMLRLARLEAGDFLPRDFLAALESRDRERAVSFGELGGLERALELVERAIALAPDRPEPYRARMARRAQALLRGLLTGLQVQETDELLAGLRADARAVRAVSAEGSEEAGEAYFVEVLLEIGGRILRLVRDEPGLLERTLDFEEQSFLEGVGRFVALFASRADEAARALFDEAEPEFRALAAVPESESSGRVGLALIALGRGDLATLVEQGLWLRGTLPELEPLLRFLIESSAFREWADFDLSDDAQLSRAIELVASEPRLGVPVLYLANKLFEGGRPERAVELYRLAVVRSPRPETARLGLAVALFRAGGHPEEARALFVELAGEQAGYAASIGSRARIGLGLLAARDGDWTAARAHFERAERGTPGEPLAVLAHAVARWKAGAEAVERDERRRLLGAHAGLVRAGTLYFARAKDTSAKLEPEERAELAGVALFALGRAEALVKELEEHGYVPRAELLRLRLAGLHRGLEVQRAGDSDSRALVARTLEVYAELEAVDELSAEEHRLAAQLEPLDGPNGAPRASAVHHAERAVAASLERDPHASWVLGELYARSGRDAEAIEVLERGVTECQRMWGDEVSHPLLDKLEQWLLALHQRGGDFGAFAALALERAERPLASERDVELAIDVCLSPSAGEWYDPPEALRLAQIAGLREWAPDPNRWILRSWAELHAGESDGGAGSLERALEARRTLDLEKPADAERARRFEERLRKLVARGQGADPAAEGEPDPQAWVRDLLQRLTPAERADWGLADY